MNDLGSGAFPTGPERPTFSIPRSRVRTTGRVLILLPDDVSAGMNAIQRITGVDVARAADTVDGAVHTTEATSVSAVVYDKLGVAVVPAEPEHLRQLAIAASSDEDPILAIEPERIVYALPDRSIVPLSVEYLRGYRDAVNSLTDSVASVASAPSTIAPTPTADQAKETWGLHATGVVNSSCSGRGVKVAILDTGLELNHPDLVNRQITAQSFVAGEDPQDVHGHGTHTTGTACGPREPEILPRYGIAFAAQIFAGKVLGNDGSGTDGQILAGINWAITNGCRIVSMSLGAPAQPGQSFSQVWERAAQRALAAGTLIIAAAGNESERGANLVAPVGHPANCPSIMAVGALDEALAVADFSCGSVNPAGGEVDIIGPGVAVHSSWVLPTQYRTISGTSMATPHVSGIAALYAEAFPNISAGELFGLLMRRAARLPLSSADAGSGLVQAP